MKNIQNSNMSAVNTHSPLQSALLQSLEPKQLADNLNTHTTESMNRYSHLKTLFDTIDYLINEKDDSREVWGLLQIGKQLSEQYTYEACEQVEHLESDIKKLAKTKEVSNA